MLVPRFEVSGRVAGGSPARFLLHLEAGEAAVLEVGQSEVDVLAEVLDPDGTVLLRYDTPVDRDAPERFCWIASRSGEFGLLIHPFEGGRGRFTVEVTARRPATEEDRACATASEELMELLPAVAAEASEAHVERFDQLQRLAQEAGRIELEALVLRQKASLLEVLGRGGDAVRAYGQALARAEDAGSAFLQGSVLNRWGLALRNQGDLGQAEALVQRALDLGRETGNRRAEASALNNLALVDKAAGETHRAIERYLEALPIFREIGFEPGEIVTLTNLAEAYGLLDQHREALEILDQLLLLARRRSDREQEAAILASQGWIYHQQSRPQRALPLLEEALAIHRQRGDRDGEAALLDRLGTVHKGAGELAEAEASYRGALELSREFGNPQEIASTTVNLGCLHQLQGRLEEARDWLLDGKSQFEALDDPKSLAHVHYCLALVDRDAEDGAEALGHAREAVETVDGLRAAAREMGARYRPIWLWQDYAELYLELLMRQAEVTGDPSFAVQAFEEGDVIRARNLFELVLESAVGVRAQAPPELLHRERRIQAQINQLQGARRRLEEEQAVPGEVAEIERQLRTLSLDLERARAQIRRADPQFAELADPRPVQLKDVQALLPPGTVLLSYGLGRDASYLYAVGPSSFETRALLGRQSLESSTEALYRGLQRLAGWEIQQQLHAERLSSWLLPPDLIPLGTERLWIVADGLLHYLPFAALPSPKAPAGTGSDQRVVDDFEVLHLPSASVLAALHRRDQERPPAPLEVQIFADPIFQQNDERLQGGSSASSKAAEGIEALRGIRAERLPKGPLPRLPWTGVEAERILALADPGMSSAALSFEASKDAVLTAPLDQYRIVHFATHAVVDEEFPELSGMVLSRVDVAGAEIDGDLYLHEIFDLRLNAQLVTLSGCQTALGKHVRGDGLLSLTRGFFYAGASQVLVSLWPVHDEATAELMGEFYRGLLELHEPPSAALRRAQLHLAASEQWSAPFYWSAFVLQGTGTAE
ncbi:MAG: CHAT domain-containing tetratricopeptide repeat protein [Acidobacteriota bacterium]|nr:CHAT domain-containing tetratricopeptide repeat protein [Acidobacteriota bacterium]